MKRLLLLALLVISISGCAWLGEQRLNADACRKDAECWADAINHAKEVGEKAGDLASLSPVPASANIAKSVVGYASLVFFLVAGGKKLRKKNEPV